jgi:hypothetical protein
MHVYDARSSAATVIVVCAWVRQSQVGMIDRCGLIGGVTGADVMFRLMQATALGLIALQWIDGEPIQVLEPDGGRRLER